MSELVVIASPFGLLALPIDALRIARSRADALNLVPVPTSSESECAKSAPQLVDAPEAARQLGVKASWLLQRAREHRVPHFRAGKFVRFDLEELRRVLCRSATEPTR
jgi:hypothetical protein